MTTKPLNCAICGYWASDFADLAKHKNTRKCRRNRLFCIYQVKRVALIKSQTFELLQNDKVKMLKNPHPLGLEVKIAEQEQVLTDITSFNSKNNIYFKGRGAQPRGGPGHSHCRTESAKELSASTQQYQVGVFVNLSLLRDIGKPTNYI